MSPTRRAVATNAISRRAESLVRSLVGIADVLILTHPDGAVAAVQAVPEEGFTASQLTRNVRSALLAGLGIRLLPGAISVVDALDRPAAAPPPAAPAPAAHPRSRTVIRHDGATARNGHGTPEDAGDVGKGRPAANAHPAGNGHGNSPGNGPATEPGAPADQWLTFPAPHRPRTRGTPRPRWRATLPGASRGGHTPLQTAPQPRVEDADLERIGNVLRCRVVISLGEQLFAGMAESPARPGAEVQLGARVAVDALRAGGYPQGPLQLNGASMAVVADQPHAVVSLKWWTDNDILCLAGSAPVIGSIERAAAEAVLQAIHINTDTPGNGRPS